MKLLHAQFSIWAANLDSFKKDKDDAQSLFVCFNCLCNNISQWEHLVGITSPGKLSEGWGAYTDPAICLQSF